VTFVTPGALPLTLLTSRLWSSSSDALCNGSPRVSDLSTHRLDRCLDHRRARPAGVVRTRTSACEDNRLPGSVTKWETKDLGFDWASVHNAPTKTKAGAGCTVRRGPYSLSGGWPRNSSSRFGLSFPTTPNPLFPVPRTSVFLF
jgi:hypothetical protein